MKYRYTGTVPTVCVVDGTLTEVNTGDVVNLLSPLSPEFILESEKTKIVPTPKVTPKQSKVLNNGTRTNTGILGK
tara:strand:- start:4 stop:228 length:225 start_codon:yes stop_codon:yes gene_type:complete